MSFRKTNDTQLTFRTSFTTDVVVGLTSVRVFEHAQTLGGENLG